MNQIQIPERDSIELKKNLISSIENFEFSGKYINPLELINFNKMLMDTIYDYMKESDIVIPTEVIIDKPKRPLEEILKPEVVEATKVFPEAVKEVVLISNHEEKTSVEYKPKFQKDMPINYNNGQYFCFFGNLVDQVLFSEEELAEEIEWKLELAKALGLLVCNLDDITPDVMLKILETPFNKYYNSKKEPGVVIPVVETTILKELERGMNNTKFYEYLAIAHDTYLKPLVPKNIVTLTEHQQEKYDGLMEKIDEIMNIPRGTHVLAVQEAPAKYMAVFEGAAGTGKTTTMAKILDTLVEKGYTMCFCSPTHQALGVIRETLVENELEFTESPEEFVSGFGPNIIIRTLASFLGIKMKRDMETGEESFTTDKRAVTFKIDILCIDESSMVSRDQIVLLLKRLRVDFDMILWVGDEPQLPSPSDGNETNGVFNLPFKYSLTQVVRQAEGSQLLQLAHYIRNLILSKQTSYLPSQLITEQLHNNHDIFVSRNQNDFLSYYFNDPIKEKIISTYTNKITNEYNSYIRNMAISNQIPGTKLDIVTNGESYLNTIDKINFISDWKDYKEFFPGEKLIVTEVNQANGSVIHQNGEIITIETCQRLTHTLYIETPSTNMMEGPSLQEYNIDYWKIVDTKYKTINIVVGEHKDLYTQILMALKSETDRKTGKNKWKKYWDYKEKFSSVNYLFAATLYKLQGSTYGHLYADLRDLDKFHKWNPVIVYKLLYVALTRPKQKIIILI